MTFSKVRWNIAHGAVAASLLAIGFLSACGEASTPEPEGKTAETSSNKADGKDDKAPKTADSTESTSSPEPSIDAVDDLSETDLMAQAMKGGQSVVCRHSYEGAPLKVYVENEQVFRVDVKTPTGDARLLYQDGSVYVWVGNMTTGFVAKTDGTTPMGAGMKVFTPEEIESIPGSKGAKCRPYTGPKSVFDLPKKVKFNEMSTTP